MVASCGCHPGTSNLGIRMLIAVKAKSQLLRVFNMDSLLGRDDQIGCLIPCNYHVTTIIQIHVIFPL